MCTLKLPPDARVVGPQDSTCGAEPEVGPRPGWAWVSIVPVPPVPDPAGSGSLTVTPLAVPVPVLVTVTVNPIGSPAFPGEASAVLVIVMSAGWQVMSAVAEPPPSLVDAAVAVLS